MKNSILYNSRPQHVIYDKLKEFDNDKNIVLYYKIDSFDTAFFCDNYFTD